MIGIEIEVSYEGADKEVVIIFAKGYIDTTTAPEIDKVIDEQLASGLYKIIVNLKEINYISSAGWGVFVSDVNEIRANNGDIVLVNMSPAVHNVFELMEFSLILKSFDSIDRAISYFLGVKPRKIQSETVKTRVPIVNDNQIIVNSPISSKREEEVPVASSSKRKEEVPIASSSKRKEAVPVASSSKRKEAVPVASSLKKIKSYSNEVAALTHNELGRKILKVILDYPYFNVKEITLALRLPQYGGKRVWKLAVKRELKFMDLIDQRERFEFVMRNKP